MGWRHVQLQSQNLEKGWGETWNMYGRLLRSSICWPILQEHWHSCFLLLSLGPDSDVLFSNQHNCVKIFSNIQVTRKLSLTGSNHFGARTREFIKIDLMFMKFPQFWNPDTFIVFTINWNRKINKMKRINLGRMTSLFLVCSKTTSVYSTLLSNWSWLKLMQDLFYCTHETISCQFTKATYTSFVLVAVKEAATGGWL